MRVPSTKITKILLIEDDDEDAMLFSENFREAATRAGSPMVEITRARNLTEGLDYAHKEQWSEIFLDLNLPEGRGIEVLEKVRSVAGTATPIVIITGIGDEQMTVEALRAGAQEYLVKGSDHVHAGALDRALSHCFYANGQVSVSNERQAAMLATLTTHTNLLIQQSSETRSMLVKHDERLSGLEALVLSVKLSSKLTMGLLTILGAVFIFGKQVMEFIQAIPQKAAHATSMIHAVTPTPPPPPTVPIPTKARK